MLLSNRFASLSPLFLTLGLAACSAEKPLPSAPKTSSEAAPVAADGAGTGEGAGIAEGTPAAIANTDENHGAPSGEDTVATKDSLTKEPFTTDEDAPAPDAEEETAEVSTLSMLRAEACEAPQCPQTEIAGQWRRGCVSASPEEVGFVSKAVSIRVNGNVLTRVYRLSKYEKCKNPGLLEEDRYLLRQGEDRGANIKEIDLIRIGHTLRPLRKYVSDNLNQRRVCGRSDYAPETTTECLSALESRITDLYTLDEGKLYFGARISPDATRRPVSIDRASPYKKIAPPTHVPRQPYEADGI